MFRISKFLFIALLFFGKLCFAQDVAILADDARFWANTKGQELLQILSEKDLVTKYTKLDKMLMEDVDINHISKFVIGKYGKHMTPQQKSIYSDLFYRYILSLYKRFELNMNSSDVDFTIDKIVEHPLFTTVSCKINASINLTDDKENTDIPIRFKLVRGQQNRIQAVDVEISEASLVLEYRRRFYQMIKEEDEDINWFLDKFKDIVMANEENALKKLQLSQN